MGVKPPGKDTVQVLPSQEISALSLRQVQLPAGVGCDMHPAKIASMGTVKITGLWVLIIFWVLLWGVITITFVLPTTRKGSIAKFGFV